jgi:hypothetical protein
MHAPYNPDSRGASIGQPKDMEPPKQVEKAEAPAAKAKAPAPGAEACCLANVVGKSQLTTAQGLV